MYLVNDVNKKSISSLTFRIGVLLLLLSSFQPIALAQTQSHPLSEVTPIDVSLDMQQKNITNVSYVGVGVTVPLYPLDVSGSGRISSNLYIGTAGRYLYDTGSAIGLSSSLIIGGNWINVSNVNSSQLCLGNSCKTAWPSGISGSGNINYITIWTATDAIGNSLINQTSGNVWITSGSLNLLSGALQVAGTTVIDPSRNVVAGSWVNATNVNVTGAFYGAGTGLTGTASSLTAGGVSCTGCIGSTQVASLDASDITTGTISNLLLDTRIYWINSTGLSAANITSGVFDVARIPDLDASKITSGTFAAARIPTLDYSKVGSLYGENITGGTIASARLSGIYSGITGLGTQAQNLNMGGYGIVSASWLNATNVNASTQICLGGVCQSNWPSGISGSGTAGYIPEWQDSSTLNNSAIYQLGSNIGIGTTNPASLLHIKGTGALLNVSNGTTSILSVNDTAPGYTIINGRVGINTVGPTQALYVSGNAYATGTLYSGSDIYTTGSGDDLWLGTSTQANSAMQLYASGRLNVLFGNLTVNETTGNLGIGTAAPVKKLDVVGDVNATGDVYTAGSLVQKRVTGSCSAQNAIRVVNADGTVTCESIPQGTVTNVATGNGLTGGPITTTGTISVSSPTCSGTDKLQWTGTAFQCAADQNSGGTVTSVGLSMPTQFSITGSPVTTSGTLTASWNSQTANTVLAAPDGSSGTPTFRALASADIPNLDASKITSGTISNARLDSRIYWINSSGLSAGNISTGTFDTARIPVLDYTKVTIMGENITAGTIPLARLSGITASQLTSNLGLLWGNLTGYNLNTVWNGELGWGNLTAYPSACSAGQAVTQVSDASLGCSAFQTGTELINTTSEIRNAMNASGYYLFTAADLVCTDCIGGTEISESSLSIDAGTITSGTLSNARLDSRIYWINSTTGLSASNITSGVFDTARIPNLDASKITSGTIGNVRLDSNIAFENESNIFTSRNDFRGIFNASIDASNITSGTFAVARIPDLDASKITSGIISNARLDSNIAWVNKTQTFTAAQTINSLTLGGNMNAANYDVYGIKNVNTTNLFASGNVGIGTTGPDSKLHVIGGLCVESSDTGCAAGNAEIRAAKFTDVDSTGYYLDPYSTSYLNYVNVASNITLGNGGATVTNRILGKRNFYAGDNTEVSTGSTTYVEKKNMVGAFDDTYSIKPRYVNVLARLLNTGGYTTYLNVTFNTTSTLCAQGELTTTSSSYTLVKSSIDVSSCSNGPVDIHVYLKTSNAAGTAKNELIEFWFVE